MLTQRTANIVFCIVVVTACAWFGWVAQGFAASGLLATSGLPSRFFPQLTLALVALCAFFVVLGYLRQPATDNTVFANSGEARRGLLMLLVAVVCYGVWSFFGFLPMLLLIGPLSLLAMGVRSVMIYVVVIALAALIYVLFTRLLGVQF
ncbi:MAG: tripartite tricarboxylate transporter TctB family protein [Granulosicoccus sp.]|nr:tripartite tricarboxylate transporter TctB family protein [Granulosicoccus sp.]